MYNPFEDPLRRRQQSQLDPQMFAPVQQPPPLFAAPVAPGPQMPMQMAPMGQEQDLQPSMKSAAGGIDSLLKRFQRPEGFGGGTTKGTDMGRAVKLPGFSRY